LKQGCRRREPTMRRESAMIVLRVVAIFAVAVGWFYLVVP